MRKYKLHYTNDDLLSRAREFYKKNGKPPRIADFNPGFAVTAKKRFGSWNDYVKTALNVRPNYHHWKREELILLAQKFWKKHHRFPADTELVEDGRDIHDIIVYQFGSMSQYFEKSIGTSLRVEILRAILELTTGRCNEATPAEILAQIRKKVPCTINSCSMTTRFLSDAGYIINGKYDRSVWHKLTPKGKTFLQSFSVGAQKVMPASSDGGKHGKQ